MFGLTLKRRAPAGLAAPEPPPPPPPPPRAEAPPPPSPHVEILQRWMSLAATQQQVIAALASEITRTSNYVETGADALSQTFQRLATSAQQQTDRVSSLTSLATGVEVDGQSIPIDEIAALLENTLSDVVMKILMLSKDSMSMVYALDVLSGNIQNVEKCNGRIDGINGTLTMLALNARIEAERAGNAGDAFRVVANEVRDLSKSTKALASTMNTELKTITDGLVDSHVILKRVATVDMSANLMTKERIETLLKALVERKNSLSMVVADALKEAEVISADVGAMVTGLQFQDRAKQRLEHVVDTLHVITQAIEETKSSTVAALPELTFAAVPDTGWIKQLLARYTMSELRDRFVSEILDGKPMEWADDNAQETATTSTGSMELF